MSDLSITLATGMHERARPLAEGRVSADGLNLTTVMLKNNGARHDRFLAGEFDAAEFSFALYLRCWSQRMDFEAIPLFFNRQFRHGSIFVNVDCGIQNPLDLEGKRIGVASWFNTAALWARGALQHECGVDIAKVRWITAEAGEGAQANLPPGVALVDATGPLVDLLLNGRIEALITPRTIARDHRGRVKRLFPDFRSVEAAYFRKTGVFPMSHVVVVRKELLERYPWLARSLFHAGERARRLAVEYADDPEHSMLAWFGAQWEEELDLLGLEAWSYGIEPNRKTLEALVSYGCTSGLLSGRPAVEELFHPSARGLEDSPTR